MIAKPHTIHDTIVASDPKIARGQVWCRRCGNSFKVDPVACLKVGWPRCCGATMTIDSPEERPVTRLPLIRSAALPGARTAAPVSVSPFAPDGECRSRGGDVSERRHG